MPGTLLTINRKEDLEKARHWLKIAPRGTRITFESPKRSVDQNSTMHGLIRDIADQYEHCGNKYGIDDWKALLLHAFGQEVRFLPALDGQSFIPVGRQTSKLGKDEMSDFIEFILAWGSEKGIIFKTHPTPCHEGMQGGGSSPATPSPAHSAGSLSHPPRGDAADGGDAPTFTHRPRSYSEAKGNA